MKRRISAFAALLLIAAGVGWAVMPFHAMWQIREALRTADTATLEARVDWPSVRRSLKESAAETRRVVAEMAAEAAESEPSFWQRLKLAAAPGMTEPLIDRYLTAEGAPKLFSLQSTWKEKVRPKLGLKPKPGPLTGTEYEGTATDRVLAFARRIERAAFVSPTRLEVDVRDTRVAERLWRAVLAFEGSVWRLVEVQVLRRSVEGARAERAGVVRTGVR